MTNKVTSKYGVKNIAASEVQEGDFATHKGGQLDTRRVARVDRATDSVWLDVSTPTPIGPFDIENYNYARKADA
jgi:hypothetical protein